MILGTALIVLTWVLFVGLGLPVWAGVLITIAGGILVLLGLMFIVYFFNLDMKLTSKMYPILMKHYDKRKRDRRI